MKVNFGQHVPVRVHEALRMTQVDQSWVLFEQPAFNATGEDHFLESKKLFVKRSHHESNVQWYSVV